MQTIQRKRNCGILVNYKCNASCRHCLYACSPNRKDDYMSPDIAQNICNIFRQRDINIIHIGGGEPFLNMEGLLSIVEVFYKAEITIEYIETNGFWAANETQALHYLHALKQFEVNGLFISFDPFHAEYIPIGLPLLLEKMCQDTGFKYVLYKEQFRAMLDSVDQTNSHSRADLEKIISPHYLLETAQQYNLNWCGRAINIYEEYMPCMSTTDIIALSHPCHNLLKTDFFHVDLYEKYVPSTCTGITIPINKAMEGIPKGQYPAFEALVRNGVAGLLTYAEQQGFKPEKNYVSPCTLCFHIRQWLSETGSCPELDAVYYRAVSAAV